MTDESETVLALRRRIRFARDVIAAQPWTDGGTRITLGPEPLALLRDLLSDAAGVAHGELPPEGKD